MNKQQIEKIIEEIRTKRNIPEPAPHAAPSVPVPMTVLLIGGKQFAGVGFIDSHGNVNMAVDRLAEAHLSKGPVSVWINADSIIAISEAEV